tara:strand:- start:6241 stop:6684 length:444 start_codon:yes stop_codon:yes gene_type:complete
MDEMDHRRGQALVALANLGLGPIESRTVEAELTSGLCADDGGVEACVDVDVYLQRAFAAMLDAKDAAYAKGGREAAEAAGAKGARDDRTVAAILDFGNVSVTDTSVTCRKCKSTNVRAEARQTRSADEAPTIFFHCQSCDSRWRCYC